MEQEHDGRHECHESLFTGLTALADAQRHFRFEIAEQAGNLSRTYINRLIRADHSHFLHMVRAEICMMMRCVRSEVIQSLIELRDGLPDVSGDHLIDDLADLVRHGPHLLLEEGNPLTLLPPDEELKEKDHGLYDRSRNLYEYVVDRAKGGMKYHREIVFPHLRHGQELARDI